MKIKRITFIFCSIVLSVLSGCIETPDASQFHAPTISASAATSAGGIVTITCQLSKGALPSQITFRLSKSQSMSDAIVKTVIGTTGMSCSATFFGLEEGIQYYFDAEASGGRSSCRSSVGSFKTADAFDVDKDTKQINYQQQYVEFEVVSSIGLSVQIEDGADWVRESDTKAATKYRKTFLVDYNSSVEERTATIVFKSDAGGENRTVRIFQAGGPITIPDKNFKAYLVENFDKDGDGELFLDEAKTVERIDVCTDDIATLEGIEYFTKLRSLSACGTSEKINEKYVTNGKLSLLDVSKNTALDELCCDRNQLTTLNVTKNTELTRLMCSDNQLSLLDVAKNTVLNELLCENNQLTSLDVTKNPALDRLACRYNQLTKLDVTKNPAMTTLICSENQLTSLDVSKTTALITIWCDNNQLTSLDVTGNTALTQLLCYGNPNLSMVWLAPGQNINDLKYDSSVTKIVHKDDKVNIPDANFKRYLVENFDKNGNREIEYSEAYEISRIGCDGLNIRSLAGIESMVQLVDINCNGNNLSEINLSANTKLTHLSCADNDLTSLDLQYNKALVYLVMIKK